MFSVSLLNTVKKSSKLRVLSHGAADDVNIWSLWSLLHNLVTNIKVLIPCNLTVSLQDKTVRLWFDSKPADKEKQLCSLSFFTVRAMNHCCEISFLSFKCDGLQAADQRGMAEGFALSGSLLRVANIFFFSFRQKETALLPVLSLWVVS